MTVLVQNILNQAAASREKVSPIDVVMGEHWGELNLGNPLRLSLLGLVLRKQQQFGRASGGGGGSTKSFRMPLHVVRRAPQAMVKVIKNGGTVNARGMRDQMSYLEKDGDAILERSERYFGTELDTDFQEDLIEAWGLAGETKTNSDKTTHFVVSFPRDTEHGAAYRAGRAWAEELFASGTYGDVFDYYTAFHTDRAHPHIHVVVNRRGLENGDWLKVSRRSQLNYDEFRAVQVEVAAREGIILGASPRLARGLSDRPIPDAEIRQAIKEKREARPPAHTPVTAIRAAASIALFAQQIEADADIIKPKHPELAKTMKRMARAILAGREIKAGLNSKPIITIEEARQQSEFIMSRRTEILEGIDLIDIEIGTIPAGSDRNTLERDASRIKAEASVLIPDVEDLQAHSRPNAQGYYQGMRAEDVTEIETKALADEKVGLLAETAGITADAFISKFEGSEPASERLADRWRKDELEDIQKNLTYRGAQSQDKTQQLAQEAYDDLHRNALQTYRKAERDLEAHAAKKKELYRIARLIREGSKLDRDVDDSFSKDVRETLHSNELRQLEAGNTEAFKHVTKNIDEQRALSRRYLETELDGADGARKLQLVTALAKIDRDTGLAAQKSTRAARKDRDLDR